MAGASLLPTLEGDRFQSQYIKRDGIDILSFNVVLERVAIFVGGVEWTGIVFDDFGSRGLFLQGQHWADVDLRKGLIPCVWTDGRLVAILDLAADCLGCSQLIIRLENTLGETCMALVDDLIVVSLLRTLMPLGFQLIHPSTHQQGTGTLIGMTI
jgi:hypothetical protein